MHSAVGLASPASTVHPTTIEPASSRTTSSRRPAGVKPWRPTKEQLKAAASKRVPDLIRPGLEILFCGINPGLYSAAVRHHFAGPGNLFYPTLFAAGFTSRLLSAFDEHELLACGIGITNLVARASAAADELERDELHRGARVLARKVRAYQPRFLAVLGLQAYRVAFERRKACVGLQPETIGTTQIWLLPNPSGLNAYHQPAILNEMFSTFRLAACST